MVTIRDIETILTAPAGTNLVVVKVVTSEPGLYGLGCATFTQRCMAVRTAIDTHLKPMVVGRDVDRIEDLFQFMMLQGYWRNGPVVNNGVAGIDVALWDIKAKRAGVPLYQLLGGKCREGAAVYRHAGGREHAEIEDNVRAFMEQGVRHVRVHVSGYGGPRIERDEAVFGHWHRPEDAVDGAYYDRRTYTRSTVAALTHLRTVLGDGVELLHDVHERLLPAEAVELAKEMEPFRLFFLEDLLAPEDVDWFHNVRAVCTTPLAMGELFCHPREWVPLIDGRLIDFMRMHISHMGGLTPARKVAALGELHGVRTAWHGPGDVSPVGHALNLHLDLVSPNFGIQEYSGVDGPIRDVFPGMAELRLGYLYPNDRPGLGIDIDVELAARYPCEVKADTWTEARTLDGSIARP